MEAPEINPIEALLNSRHYDTNKAPQEEDILLQIRGEKIGTAGNFIALTGLPKSGKSTFINAFFASRFNDYQNKFGISLKRHPDIKRQNIGYFDTESAEFDFYKNIDRIKTMAEVTHLPGTFNAFNTRQDSRVLNRQMIEYYTTNFRAGIVVVDGLLDLVIDYNDPKECSDIISWLKMLTASNNCLFVVIIHTGKKDGHTLGHLGSMVDRYAQSVLEVTKHKESGIYSLSAKYLRSARDDFEPIHIKYQSGCYVESYPPPDEKPKNK